MNDLGDLIEDVEREIARARAAASKERQVTSDRDLEAVRQHLDNVTRAFERARQAGVLPRW